MTCKKMKRVVITPSGLVYKAQIDMTQLHFDHLFVLYCIVYDYWIVFHYQSKRIKTIITGKNYWTYHCLKI
jgi:hypothetical protein